MATVDWETVVREWEANESHSLTWLIRQVNFRNAPVDAEAVLVAAAARDFEDVIDALLDTYELADWDLVIRTLMDAGYAELLESYLRWAPDDMDPVVVANTFTDLIVDDTQDMQRVWLRWAAFNGQLPMIEEILRDGNVTDEAVHSASGTGIEGNHPAAVERLLRDDRSSVPANLNAVRSADMARVLLADPRIDYRAYQAIDPTALRLLQEEAWRRHGLFREQFVAPTLALSRQLPPELRERILGEKAYGELCADLRDGLVPSPELWELARLLRMRIPDAPISRRDLCAQIKERLDTMFDPPAKRRRRR